MSIAKRVIVAVVAVALIAVGAVVATNIFCVASTRGNVHTISQIEQSGGRADAIVVLGASVKPSGAPSDILADRLEVASDLFKAGCTPTIIASGDNRDGHYNESDNMKNYCVSLGVPADAIYVDYAGYDTYSSIYRAHFVYGAQSIMVVTQAYHLYRALMIAELLGMQAQGIPADKGSYDNQDAYSIREVFARTKDFFRSLLSIPPEEPTKPITK